MSVQPTYESFSVPDGRGGGAGKCEAFIFAGPDGKEYLVKKMIQVYTGCVDAVTVIQKGRNTLREHCLASGVAYIPLSPKAQFYEFYAKAAEFTQIGDYYITADSDEIPSATMCQYLKNRQYRESPGNSFYAAFIPHFWDESTGFFDTHVACDNSFKKLYMNKRCKNTVIKVMNQAHASAQLSSNNHPVQIDVANYVRHCKSYSEWHASVVAFMLYYPASNFIPIDSPNFAIIKAFLAEKQIDATDNVQVFDLVRNKELLTELLSRLTPIGTELQYISGLVNTYGCNIREYDFSVCKTCCNDLVSP